MQIPGLLYDWCLPVFASDPDFQDPSLPDPDLDSIGSVRVSGLQKYKIYSIGNAHFLAHKSGFEN